ncbi:TRAP transporter permease [Rhodovibrionaceae bacterium A322]
MSSTASVALKLYATGVVLWHVWLIFSGLLPNLVTRPLHMILALPFVFFFTGKDQSALSRWSGYVLGVLGFITAGWVALNRDDLNDQYGSLEGDGQIWLSLLLLLVVLEMARRAIKWVLPLVALLTLAYGLAGPYLPGEFGFAEIPLESFLGTLTIAEGGVWGPLTGISVNVIAIFILLGALVGAGEAGTGFMSLATRVAGRLRAGAAKVSVLSSALFGSISGSASANVAATGAVTLPAMKRLGYPAPLAAAVEAVASTGGQIMPPLMGAGAFVMVELLGLPYERIMAAAILPALLFFWCAWAGIDHAARRYNLKALDPSELPSWRTVLQTLPFFAVPFGLLLLVLFTTDRTPQYAAALAAGAAWLLLLLNHQGKISLQGWLERSGTAALSGARQIATLASIVLCAGIIIGVLNQTGLGVKLTSVIIGLSGGQLWLALLLTGAACLVLGMEVPTTAAYVICISVAGPALQELGLPALTAHLFVFWYALLSTITPPVCGTVFIASGMADTPWLPTAGRSMQLGLGLYLVPLAFVAHPALLDPASAPLLAAWALVKMGAGLWIASAGLAGRSDKLWLNGLAIALGLALLFLFGQGISSF